MNISWLLNIFSGTYYTVAIFEIGLAIAATCLVLNFYYSKTKMPGWLKTILLRTLAPLVRVKVKRRRLSVKESLRSTDEVAAELGFRRPEMTEDKKVSDKYLGH